MEHSRRWNLPVFADINSALDRWDLALAALGGFLAQRLLSTELHTLFASSPKLSGLLGANGEFLALVVGVLFSTVACFVVARIAANLITFFGPENPRLSERDNSQQFIDRDYELATPDFSEGLHLGELPEGDDLSPPTWLKLPWAALYTNFIALGGTGAGKTQALVYPILEQLIRRGFESGRKTALLVLDVKGDLLPKAQRIADRAGRANDVIFLGLQTETEHESPTWNPLADGTPEEAAERLIAVRENLEGGSNAETQWISENMSLLLASVIGLARLRSPSDDATFVDLDELLSGPLFAATMGDDLLEEQKQLALEDLDQSFYTRLDHEALNAQYTYYRNYALNASRSNPRNHATVTDAARVLVRPFTLPEVAETFCPEKDSATFPSISSLLNRGAIVGLALGGAHPRLTTSVGVLLKLAWQSEVLSRIQETNNPPPAAMVLDECQNFLADPKNSRVGDSLFLNQARSSNHAAFLFTQSSAFLEHRLGKNPARLVLAACRTKLFLSLPNIEDQKLASEQCNERWVDIRSESVIERARGGSRWNPVFDRVDSRGASLDEQASYKEEKRRYFEPVEFAKLKRFEAIASTYDGSHQQLPTRLYLKPAFLPMTKNRFEIEALLQSEAA